jgi:tRNA (guanosine-2'-O-)-methyltransferase
VTAPSRRQEAAAAAGSRPLGPKQLGPTDVKRLNRSWRQRAEARVGVLLDSVSQPFNVGSIIRTAAVFGAEQIWLCGDTAVPEHPQARRTALGTGRLVTFEREPDPAAAAAAGAVPLHEAPLGGDVCLALGNEDHGCSAALLAAADVVAYIPQLGRVGSLNVAAAAAIVLAEARRREWQRA